MELPAEYVPAPQRSLDFLSQLAPVQPTRNNPPTPPLKDLFNLDLLTEIPNSIPSLKWEKETPRNPFENESPKFPPIQHPIEIPDAKELIHQLIESHPLAPASLTKVKKEKKEKKDKTPRETRSSKKAMEGLDKESVFNLKRLVYRIIKQGNLDEKNSYYTKKDDIMEFLQNQKPDVVKQARSLVGVGLKKRKGKGFGPMGYVPNVFHTLPLYKGSGVHALSNKDIVKEKLSVLLGEGGVGNDSVKPLIKRLRLQLQKMK
jgi:hypothetical protein